MKIFNRYRTTINGKIQPFELKNLKNLKILIKEGTIMRREVFLMKINNTILGEEYEDFEKNGNDFQMQVMQPPINQIRNSEIEEEALMEEFNEYMDEL